VIFLIYLFFDKTLLLTDQSIGGLLLLVKGDFAGEFITKGQALFSLGLKEEPEEGRDLQHLLRGITSPDQRPH
jgi:hypothetical protein